MKVTDLSSFVMRTAALTPEEMVKKERATAEYNALLFIAEIPSKAIESAEQQEDMMAKYRPTEETEDGGQERTGEFGSEDSEGDAGPEGGGFRTSP